MILKVFWTCFTKNEAQIEPNSGILAKNKIEEKIPLLLDSTLFSI